MHFSEDLSTAALTKVIDDNLIEKSLSFPRFYGGEIHGPNPLWFITGPSMPDNNGVAQANFSASEIDRGIQDALEPFKSRGLNAVWWVGPKSSPANLGYYLQNYGLKHNRDMIGMAIDLHELKMPEEAPTDLAFEPVCDRETLAAWYALLVRGFPIPYSEAYLDSLAETCLGVDTGWYHYIARRNGAVVAISSLFNGGGVTGLYNLSTLPELRGQGIGTWMTVKTYYAARDEGYRIATLQTTYPNALRLYHKMGFEVYCKIGIYRYLHEG